MEEKKGCTRVFRSTVLYGCVSLGIVLYICIMYREPPGILTSQLKMGSKQHVGFKTKANDSYVHAKDVTAPSRFKVKTNGFLIYQCDHFCGGWADRLKGIVTGYILASITHRQFGINMTNIPCELTNVVRPNLINWDVKIDKKQLARWTKYSFFPMGSNEFYSNVKNIDFMKKFKPSKKIIYFRANLDYIDQFKQNKFHEQDLLWMKNLTRDQVYAKILKDMFILSPETQSILDSFMSRAKPTSDTRLVCAHIRRGKSSTIPSDPVRVNDKDTQDVYKFLSAYNNTKKFRIFVASDSEDIISDVKKRFGHQLVENKGNIIHIDKKNVNHKQSCDEFKKVVIDQQILIRCDVLMISFSGYSRYAAYSRGTDKDLYCLLKNHTGIQKCEMRYLKELYHVLG